MSSLILFLVFVFIIFVVLTNSKIDHLEMRSSSKKIKVEVVEYRKEKGPMRNDYTMLDYPYVKIDLDNDYMISKLKYANSFSKAFTIGDQIDVFWYGSDLLYWNAYDEGLYKYLPQKWNILN